MLEQLKKDLIGKNIPYRENGKVVSVMKKSLGMIIKKGWLVIEIS